LGFDPKVLQVISVTEGGFLKEGGVPTTFTQRIDANGQVSISSSRNSKAVGATSPGVVATLSLRASPSVTTTQTQLQLLSVSPTGLAGKSIGMPTLAPLPLSLVR
jgi:general secretion pathway protein D